MPRLKSGSVIKYIIGEGSQFFEEIEKSITPIEKKSSLKL